MRRKRIYEGGRAQRQVRRILTLLVILSQSRTWRPLESLAEYQNVSTRTIRRDLEVLQHLGATVHWSGVDGFTKSHVRFRWDAGAELVKAFASEVMRISYSDDEDFPGQFNIWQANCRRSLRGRKGQAALRRLEAALVAMPEKALRQGKLVAHDGSVCAIGALARAEGKLPEPEPLQTDEFDDEYEDEGDTSEWATDNLGFPKLVAWKVVEQNDIQLDTKWIRLEGPVRTAWELDHKWPHNLYAIVPLTPEERYDKMLAWVRAQLV